MGETKHLLVIGAGGVTGREIVARALADGHLVRAAEKPPLPSFPSHERLEARAVNVLTDDLAPLVTGTDAVLMATGLRLSPETVVNPPPLYTEGVLRVVRGMKAAGVRRLVVISASFVAARNRGPLWFQATAMPALWRIFDQMADMERILRATDGIDWTAVRPGWLLDAPFTGDYTVAEDVIPRGMIRTRHADLAHFMLRCAVSDDWIGQTPAIARRESLRHTGPHAMMEEVAKVLPHLRR